MAGRALGCKSEDKDSSNDVSVKRASRPSRTAAVDDGCTDTTAVVDTDVDDDGTSSSSNNDFFHREAGAKGAIDGAGELTLAVTGTRTGTT